MAKLFVCMLAFIILFGPIASGVMCIIGALTLIF